MKNFLIAIAALMTPTTLYAADLPSRRVPPVFVPPPAISAFTWTGFYAGLNAGYAFGARNDYTFAGNSAALAAFIGNGRPGFLGTRSSGFTGGGQIGYNYQLAPSPAGSFVFGVEADAAYTGTGNGAVFGPTVLGTSTVNGRTDYVGTVRGRVGYAFDNFLVYGTGGFAYGGVRNTSIFYGPAGGPFYSGSSNTIRTGYAYGGGVEYAIPISSFLNFFKSSAVSLKAEYLHYDLGKSTIALPNLAGVDAGYTAQVKTSGNIVRAGINYKFDFFAPASPVVARY